MTSLSALILLSFLIQLSMPCFIIFTPATTTTMKTTAAAQNGAAANEGNGGNNRRRRDADCSCTEAGAELTLGNSFSNETCSAGLLTDVHFVTTSQECGAVWPDMAQVSVDGTTVQFNIISAVYNGVHVVGKIYPSVLMEDELPLCFKSGNGGSWGQLPSAQKDMDWIEENVDG